MHVRIFDKEKRKFLVSSMTGKNRSNLIKKHNVSNYKSLSALIDASDLIISETVDEKINEITNDFESQMFVFMEAIKQRLEVECYQRIDNIITKQEQLHKQKISESFVNAKKHLSAHFLEQADNENLIFYLNEIMDAQARIHLSQTDPDVKTKTIKGNTFLFVDDEDLQIELDTRQIIDEVLDVIECEFPISLDKDK